MTHHPSPIIATGTLDPVELEAVAKAEATYKAARALHKSTRRHKHRIRMMDANHKLMAARLASEGGRG